MGALGQQVLAEFVQDDKLAGQDLGHLEALCHEHDLTDERQVRHAHGNRAEQGLEGFRQLSAAWVTGVHGDEGHDSVFEGDLRVLKDKALLPSSQGIQHSLVLRGAHRQHGNRDAIELIKAAPRAGLGQALIDLAHGLVVHLVAAVEDIALHAQGARQVLGGLSLARTGRSGRGATQHQALGLGEGDVAAVRQGSDAQAATVANVLIVVTDLGITDVDLCGDTLATSQLELHSASFQI
eukprot:scaffold281563_cov46-Prasinocladus_malaysianus.AAC.1